MTISKSRRRVLAWIFGALAGSMLLASGLAATATLTPTLKIGDPAPALKVMTWIKGQPVTRFEPGRVYVVEFWATWCGPCAAAMPHLSELQKKYAGRLTVVGIDAREADAGKADLAAVKSFVDKKGDRMAYTVAMDDPLKMTVFGDWMTAAGSYGIPTTFIVDRTGKLAWVGHPFSSSDKEFSPEFNTAIEQALNATSDLVAAKALQEKVNDETARRLKYLQTLQPLTDAQKRKDYAAVVIEADKILAAEPEYASAAFRAKLGALLHTNEDEALALARSKAQDKPFLAELHASSEDLYWSHVVGYAIAQEEGLSKAAYQLAADSLRMTADSDPDDFMSRQALAKAHYRLGNFKEAIAAQEAAIAVAHKRGYSEDYVSKLKQALAEYQSAQG
jgi:thiol-disulfide isomerase/thioredoxin